MKKLLLFPIFLISSLLVKSQDEGEYYSSWNFTAGRTGTPGDILKLGVEMGKTEKISIFTDVSAEFSRYKNINYSSYGLTIGGRYYLTGGNLLNKKINIGLGLGGTIEYDNEPIVYKEKSLSQKLNYGVSGNIILVYVYDPTIGFITGFEQKYLLNQSLGNLNYSFQIGLRIHFGVE